MNVKEPMRICDTCAAFGPQVDHGQVVECEDDGACRADPPTMLLVEDDDGWGFVSLFPPVNREDWCGRWIPKED